MKTMFRKYAPALALLAMIAIASTSLAQTVNASLSGIVSDPEGGRIPQATVLLRNNANKDTRKTTTNGQGVFEFNAVPTGTYSVTVTATGFKKLTTTGIELHPNDARELSEMKLPVGAEDISVTVEATTEMASSGERSSLITAKDIQKLSTVGRDVTELLKTQPGFSLLQSGLDNGGASSAEVAGAYSGLGNYVGSGATGNGASIISDGANVTDPGSGSGQTQIVNMDMVSEVKIETSNFGADTAKGPTVITAVGKSGTSSFHGSLHLFARTTQLNAQDWFTKYIGIPRIPDRYIYPGFDVGGPVIIPDTKFNSNRKLTFQLDGEDYIQRDSYAYGSPLKSFINALVPTANMRNGNFTLAELSNYLGVDTTLLKTDCSAAGKLSIYEHVCSQPNGGIFQGGMVTGVGNQIDSNAAALLNEFPLPNQPNTKGYNYSALNLENPDMYQIRTRVDLAINDSNKIYMVYSGQFGLTTGIPEQIYYSPSAGGTQQGGLDTPGKINSTDKSNLGSVNYTHIFSASMTNEVFAAISYVGNYFQPGDFTKLTQNYNGYHGSYIFPGATQEIPQLASYNVAGLPLAITPDFSEGEYKATKLIPSGGDNFSYLIRTHTVKFGGYLERDAANQTDLSPVTNGSINQYYIPTSQARAVSCDATIQANCTQNYLADFFEGIIQQFNQQNFNAATDLHYWNTGFYGTDSWKITKHLTIDYGLRIEHYGPWTDTHNIGIATFIPSLYNSDAKNAANPDGTLFLPGIRWAGGNAKTNGNAGYTGVPISGNPSRAFFYSPRVGVALDMYGNGKTIFRGGWGEYRGHDSWNDFVAPAATSEGLVTVSANNGALTLENIPANPTPGSAGAIGAYACNINTTSGCPSVFAVDPTDSEQPLTMTYSFSVTQQMPESVVFDIAYVGNQSSHLLTDNISNTSLQTGDLRNIDAVPLDAMFKPDPNPSSTSFGQVINPEDANVSQTNDFRPYSAYSGLGVPRHIAYANYNALQVSLNRQRGKLNFGLNYTFSKALGVRGGYNNGYTTDPTNLREDYGPLAFDRTHIAAASYSYDEGAAVHFGGRFTQQLLNYWFISGITNLQSGPNLQAVYSPDLMLSGSTATQTNNYPCPGGACNIDSRTLLGSPDIYLQPTLRPGAGCPSGNPTANLANRQYVNGNCFGLPPVGINGPANLGYLRAPGFFNSDLTVQKTIGFAAQRYLQFRLSGFNFLNHPITAFSSRFTNEASLQLNGNSFDTATLLNGGNGTQSCSAIGTTCFGYAGYKTGRRVLEVSVRYNF